jgi:hypothetical protein
MADIIDDFVMLTQHILSPDIHRLWAGISMVSSALGRRVWITNAQGAVFPNLYILLVAPPGTGKSVVDRARDILTEVCEPGTKIPALAVAPDSMTKASMIDELQKAKKTFLPPTGSFLEYHSLVIAQEELAVLLPAYDMEFVSTLNALWNNKKLHHEVRRTGRSQNVSITNPQLSILSATQPDMIAKVFPEDAWNTGIGRRLIMIYAGQSQWKDIWQFRTTDNVLRDSIISRLGKLTTAFGEMDIQREVIELLTQWDQSGREPRPEHAKLQGYETTRYLYLIKLAIISSASRGDMNVEIDDLHRAMDWLFAAESVMPDIFRAMVGRSDRDVIDELHMYATKEYGRGRMKPIAGDQLRRFLLERVPHDKVDSLLMSCERAGIIMMDAAGGDRWVPQPKRNMQSKREDE